MTQEITDKQFAELCERMFDISNAYKRWKSQNPSKHPHEFPGRKEFIRIEKTIDSILIERSNQ